MKSMCSSCSSSKIKARGLCSRCYNKWHYQNNKEMHSSKNKHWVKKNREYNIERNRLWVVENKKHRHEYNVERYRDNKERLREGERRWRATDNGKRKRAINEARRRARIRSNSNKSQDINVKIIQDTITFCSYCGISKNLSIEHIIPISRGGDNSLNNLTKACISCNSSKQDMDLLEWIKINNLSVFDETVLNKYQLLSDK